MASCVEAPARRRPTVFRALSSPRPSRTARFACKTGIRWAPNCGAWFPVKKHHRSPPTSTESHWVVQLHGGVGHLDWQPAGRDTQPVVPVPYPKVLPARTPAVAARSLHARFRRSGIPPTLTAQSPGRPNLGRSSLLAWRDPVLDLPTLRSLRAFRTFRQRLGGHQSCWC